MRLRINIIGLCLLSMFIVILGSILIMPLFGDGNTAPTEINIDAAAATGEESGIPGSGSLGEALSRSKPTSSEDTGP
jgi:hypothetical protein